MICVYNPNRLEWHPGDECRYIEPLRFLWWVLTSNKRGFCRHSIVLLLLTPRAKIHQRDLRGFCFQAQIGLHPIAVHLNGWLGRKHRLCDTPHISRPALIERLVKSEGHGGTRPLMKQINPSWALGLSSLNESRRVK